MNIYFYHICTLLSLVAVHKLLYNTFIIKKRHIFRNDLRVVQIQSTGHPF